MNTNKAYEAMAARKAYRMTPDGYRYQLIEWADAFRRQIKDLEQGTKEWKRMAIKINTLLAEMTRVGIEVLPE